MNPLLLHPLFLEFRRRRGEFLFSELICRPQEGPQDDFAGELKTWLFSSPGRGAFPVWITRREPGAFLSGRFSLNGGIRGQFSLETPEADCLGFELVDASGREGLIPLPEGNGLTYFSLWRQENS